LTRTPGRGMVIKEKDCAQVRESPYLRIN
jgi:hypothetical protein